MSTRNHITSNPPRLRYSCRCGWLDLGHMDSTSYRANEGAADLWEQIQKERGSRSKQSPDGFEVRYQQTHAKKKLGITFRDGVYRSYWVKSGLSVADKKSVALAIFKEVSLGFETLQSSWFYTTIPGAKTDSGFSAEDLVSNLIGFYKAIDPTLDVAKICGVVGEAASLDVWDKYGSVGQHKNKGFRPMFFPCAECRCGTPADDAACRSGEFSHGGNRVKVAEDGRIVVKSGDALSRYSAAMYRGDTSRVNEFGRLRGDTVERISNPNAIVAGETVYHIPTYEVARQASGAGRPVPWVGTLPDEFQTIAPIVKGKLFRDWTMKDSLSQDEVDRAGMMRGPKF